MQMKFVIIYGTMEISIHQRDESEIHDEKKKSINQSNYSR